MRRIAFVVPVFLLIAASLYAQAPHWSTSGCTDEESSAGNAWVNGWGWGQQERVCEVRRTVLPLKGGQINITGKNGGIHILGEDRSDVALVATVTAFASSKAKAEQVESQVKILTDGTIHDEGPFTSGWFFRSGYSVDYTVHVPRHVSAELHTVNGGIDIAQVDGSLRAETTNGGLAFKDVAGDMRGETINGGIKVYLAGDSWHGAGLHAQSVNGGIVLTVPDGYSAHLVTRTVNGGITLKFPVTVRGDLKNHLDATLGKGGATIDLETTNGGVSIAHGDGVD